MKIECPECGSISLEIDENEILCKFCGLLFTMEESLESKKIIDNNEDILMDNEKEQTKGLVILKNVLKARDADEVAVIRAFKILEEASEILELPPEVRIRAAEIYKKAAIEGITRGRSMNSIIAASTYIACKLLDYPITLDFLARTYNENRKSVYKSAKLLINKLKISFDKKSVLDYIYMVAIKIRLNDQEAINLALDMMKKGLKKINISGKMKQGYAGAALYLAARKRGKKVTLRQISAALNITEVTLWKRSKDLKSVLK